MRLGAESPYLPAEALLAAAFAAPKEVHLQLQLTKPSPRCPGIVAAADMLSCKG